MALRQYGEDKRTRFLISVDADEEKVLRQAAKLHTLPLAVYVRWVATEAAREYIAKKGSKRAGK